MYFFIHGGGGLTKSYSDGGGGMRKKSEIGGGGHTIFKLHSSKSHQPPLPHEKWTVPKSSLQASVILIYCGQMSKVLLFKMSSPLDYSLMI